MDKNFKDFKTRIDRKINVMEAKISYMHDGLKGFHEALADFKVEFDQFIDFTSDSYSDHEMSISSNHTKRG